MKLKHVHHWTFDKLKCAISIICLAVVLVLVLGGQVLVLVRGGQVLVLVLGGQVLVLVLGSQVLVLGNQVLVLVLGGQELVLVVGGQVLVNILGDVWNVPGNWKIPVKVYIVKLYSLAVLHEHVVRFLAGPSFATSNRPLTNSHAHRGQ